MDHSAAIAGQLAATSVALMTVASTIIGWLPAISSLLIVIWWGLRIYETPTVKGAIQRWRARARWRQRAHNTKGEKR